MTADATVDLRYDENERVVVEQKLRRLVRTQGALLLVLGVMLATLVLVPVAAAAAAGVTAALIVGAGALLVVPAVLVVLGLRQVRRRPRLPQVAVTVTPTAVQFPTGERPSALMPVVRAEEWPRAGTGVAILPASGLQAARLEFTRRDGGRFRRRSIAVGSLADDAQVIVDALGGPLPH